MKSEANSNWSKDEFYTYLLIYCMNADFKESVSELEMIITKVGYELFHKMDVEFERDSDYESIQKIKNSLTELNLDKAEIDELFEDIKKLFLSDGKFETLERNLLVGLKRFF